MDKPSFLPVKFIAYPSLIYIDFVILLISFYIWYPQSSNAELLHYLTDQWNQSPIIDIVDSRKNDTYENLSEVSKWINDELEILFNESSHKKI